MQTAILTLGENRERLGIREVSSSAQVGYQITMDWVTNNKYLFLTVLEAGKSEIRVPAEPVSGGGLLAGLQVAIFSLSSCSGEQREGNLLAFDYVSLYHF